MIHLADMSEDMIDQLVHDILSITDDLTRQGSTAERLSALSHSGGPGSLVSSLQHHESKTNHNLRKNIHVPKQGGVQGNQGKQC